MPATHLMHCNLSPFFHFILVVAMGIAAGLIRFLHRYLRSQRPCNRWVLANQILTSTFVTVIVFMGIEGLNQPTLLSAACAGLAGLWPEWLLRQAKRLIDRWLKKWTEKFNQK